MKLSNKILIGFFGFIFLYLTAVFAEIRLRGTPNIIDDENSIAETVDIAGVSYLFLHDLKDHINVVGSHQAKLEVRSFTGGLLQGFRYNISGDTLVLSGLDSQRTGPIKITLFVPQSALHGVRVDNALAIVSHLHLDSLHISQHAGRIWISGSRIEKIHVEASDKSQVDISSTDMDTLSATIEGSQMLLSSPLRLLKGSMKNNSFVRVHDIDEIQFKKDDSSKLNMYQ